MIEEEILQPFSKKIFGKGFLSKGLMAQAINLIEEETDENQKIQQQQDQINNYIMDEYDGP